MIYKKHIHSKGFTLAESVIALGILVVLITGFLAVFGPATDAIRRTLSGEEASRLQDTLQNELTTLRGERERNIYDEDSFRKTFDWISRSNSPGGSILLYNYRANPGSTRDDGTLERYDGNTGVAGQDFIVQPMARRLDDDLLQVDLESVEGRVFFVKLAQLVNTDGAWRTTVDPRETGAESELSKIVDPYDDGERDFSTSPSEFPEAVVVVEASFFSLPTNTFQYISTFDPTNFTRPVFTRNLGILR